MASRAEVEGALDKARAFLLEAQLPNGELPIEFHPRLPDGRFAPGKLSPSVFATMYACLSLSVDDSPASSTIIQRAHQFLWPQQVPPGLWKYAAPGERNPRHFAADIDTSCGMLSLARALGWEAPDARWIVAMNHRRDGRFYTWFAPGNLRTYNPRYWWYILRDPSVGRFFRFFRGVWWDPRDIDVVINIHVVSYLGDCPETQGAIEWILDSARTGTEVERDKWYHDRSSFYLALARAYADGVPRFRDVLPIVESRIAERAEPSGEIGGHPMFTAFSAAALLHFGVGGSVVDRAIAFLCASQDAEGAWPAGAHYWGGPRNAGWFGSRTYSTALAIEALALYRRTVDA
ncbi:MAG: hypothetical protein U0164_03995 [Gemmatimonadaceae bacterium]